MVMMIGSLHSTIDHSPQPQKPRNTQTIAMSPFPVSHCQLADLFCILYFRTIVRSVPSFYGRLFYEGVGKSMAPHIESNMTQIRWSIALLLGSMYFCSWLAENEVHKSWWQTLNSFFPVTIWTKKCHKVSPLTPRKCTLSPKMANLTKSITKELFIYYVIQFGGLGWQTGRQATF